MFKDYNMNQLVFPLDLEVKLQNNDIAFHVHHLVKSIPCEAVSDLQRAALCCENRNIKGIPKSLAHVIAILKQIMMQHLCE